MGSLCPILDLYSCSKYLSVPLLKLQTSRSSAIAILKETGLFLWILPTLLCMSVSFGVKGFLWFVHNGNTYEFLCLPFWV